MRGTVSGAAIAGCSAAASPTMVAVIAPAGTVGGWCPPESLAAMIATAIAVAPMTGHAATVTQTAQTPTADRRDNDVRGDDFPAAICARSAARVAS